MEFEWDPAKADANEIKHGVSFTVAATVFGDIFSQTFMDSFHSEEEQRLITLGLSERNHILVISHVLRNNKTRIISARKATAKERNNYEEEKRPSREG